MRKRTGRPGPVARGARALASTGGRAEPPRLWVPNLLRVERLREASHWVAEDRPQEVNSLLLDFLSNPLAALPR